MDGLRTADVERLIAEEQTAAPFCKGCPGFGLNAVGLHEGDGIDLERLYDPSSSDPMATRAVPRMRSQPTCCGRCCAAQSRPSAHPTGASIGWPAPAPEPASPGTAARTSHGQTLHRNIGLFPPYKCKGVQKPLPGVQISMAFVSRIPSRSEKTVAQTVPPIHPGDKP